MKNVHTRFIVVVILITITISCAPTLKNNLIKAEDLNKGFSGIMVFDVENDDVLFEYNADKYFTPASNTKILTLLTGLTILEDSIVAFEFTQDKDSLIFTATGDPTLLNPKFNSTRSLKLLKDSKAKLYYQKSNWTHSKYGSGWAWDDFNYSFSAQRSALPVYGNLVQFEYDESLKSWKSLPEFFQDSIEIHEKSEANRISNTNTFKLPNALQNKSFKIIPFNTSEELSIQLLESELKKPIQIINSNKKLNNKIYSILADSLYKEMMHQSDNFIAEQILLMSSQKISDTLNTEITINHMQENYLKTLKNEIFWIDGSGLSRYNLATPKSIVEVLKLILKQKNFSQIKNMFPTAGKHGTVKDILRNEKEFVYAKSGSLRNNYSISGYLISNKGKLLLFSFMNSNYTIPSSELKSNIEKLLIQIRNNN